MNPILLLLAACLASAVACGRSQQADDGHPDRHDREELIAPGAAGNGDDVLRVVPEMMRDLRVTTAAVEERGAVEGASVLGELGPNEDAYAIVASPISARIRRMLARPAERVESAARCAELESVGLVDLRVQSCSHGGPGSTSPSARSRARVGLNSRSDSRLDGAGKTESTAATARATSPPPRPRSGRSGFAKRRRTCVGERRFVLRSAHSGNGAVERSGPRGEATDSGHALLPPSGDLVALVADRSCLRNTSPWLLR